MKGKRKHYWAKSEMKIKCSCISDCGWYAWGKNQGVTGVNMVNKYIVF